MLPQGIGELYRGIPDILEDAENALPGPLRALLRRLLARLKRLDRDVAKLKADIVAWHVHNEDSQRLERIGGFGPLTATAFVASVGNAKSFRNGRQVAAWLGLVPRQDSSGGKTRLLGISKHGDVYLRTLLIHRARAVLRHLGHRAHGTDDWLRRLLARRNNNVAAVALANKNARIAWALLAHDRDFVSDYVSTAPSC